MNPKVTVGLGIALAVAVAAYFLAGPGEVPKTEQPGLLAGLDAAGVSRVELAREGGPVIALAKSGDQWRIVAPRDLPADPAGVQGILQTLTRFRPEMEQPDAPADVTGLDAPRLTVTFFGRTAQKTLKFGKSPATHSKAVYYRIEEDPRLFLTGLETLEALSKDVESLRSKRVAAFGVHAVMKIELENRYLRVVAPDPKPRVDWERSVLEKVELGPTRGWHLRKPWEEILDPNKVIRLLDRVARLQATGFVSADGFEAETIVRLHLRGAGDPIEILFGGASKDGRSRLVRSGAMDETALVDERAWEQIPLRRNDFRIDRIFSVRADELRRLTVEAEGIGRTVIEREVKKAGPDEPERETWKVVEPADAKAAPETVASFAGNLLVQRFAEFLGPQENLALFGLESPSVTVTVEPAGDRPPQQAHFGKTAADAYLRKEGVGEVFRVAPAFVDRLRLLELPFVSNDVFLSPREDLIEVHFESRGVPPVSWELALDPDTGTWRFRDEAHKDREPVPERVDGLLTLVSYIGARHYVTREPERIRELRLEEKRAPATLKIYTRESPTKPAVFYISTDQADRAGQETLDVFYVLRRGSPGVFEINDQIVKALREFDRP